MYQGDGREPPCREDTLGWLARTAAIDEDVPFIGNSHRDRDRAGLVAVPIATDPRLPGINSTRPSATTGPTQRLSPGMVVESWSVATGLPLAVEG